MRFQFHSTEPALAPPTFNLKQACSGLQPHLHACALLTFGASSPSLKKGISCSTCKEHLGLDTGL